MIDKKQIVLYVILGTLLMLLLGIVYSYSMFRLEIETVYNANHFESGIPYMTVLFVYSSFMAIGGVMYTKFNTKYVAFSGVLLISVGFIASAFATNILIITITYGLIVGIGVGLLYGLPLRIIPQLNFHRPGLLTGIVLLGFGLSPLVFAPLVNFLIENYGLSNTFLYLGIAYLLISTPLVLLLITKDILPKNNNKINYEIIKNKKFQSLYILFFLGTFIGLTFIGFTANIGKELIGINAARIAILIALFAIFNGLGRPLFGYLHDKFGFKRSAMFSFISIGLATMLIYLFSYNYFVFLFSFSVFYLNFGGWLSLSSATTMELFGKTNYSKNFGFMYTAYGVGAILGNSISGFLVESMGLRSIFLLMSFISMIGLIVTIVKFKDYKKGMLIE